MKASLLNLPVSSALHGEPRAGAVPATEINKSHAPSPGHRVGTQTCTLLLLIRIPSFSPVRGNNYLAQHCHYHWQLHQGTPGKCCIPGAGSCSPVWGNLVVLPKVQGQQDSGAYQLWSGLTDWRWTWACLAGFWGSLLSPCDISLAAVGGQQSGLQ